MIRPASLLPRLCAALVLAGGTAVAAPQAPPASHAPQAVIVDTDFGSDIDDAFAIALVLASPGLEPLLFTASQGDTALRARLLRRFLDAGGRPDLPVAAGPAGPGDDSPVTQGEWAATETRASPDAVAALLDTLRAAPARHIVLLALGPLTTVDAALQRDPATFARLRKVVLMGGSIRRGYGDQAGTNSETPGAEYNVKLAPAALRRLLASGVAVEMLPLDATEVALPADLQAAVFAAATPWARPLSQLYPLWAARNPWGTVPTLFDVVPVARLLDPGVCTPVPMHVAVADDGMTRPAPGRANAGVCLDVDRARVLALLRRALVPAP